MLLPHPRCSGKDVSGLPSSHNPSRMTTVILVGLSAIACLAFVATLLYVCFVSKQMHDDIKRRRIKEEE
jgi:hypothetical protein